MPTIINKRKSDPWGDILGGIGQGLSGFAGGYMGRQQMDAAKAQSQAMQGLMGRMFGGPGGINPMAGGAGAGGMAPTTGGIAQDMGLIPQSPAGPQPTPIARTGGTGAGMDTTTLDELLRRNNPSFGRF